MPVVYKEVEVDVELDDFDTDELIEELERRGTGTGTIEYGNGTEVLRAIYEKRRLAQDYQSELDQLIWLGLGRFI